MNKFPQARKEKLVVRELADEILIYDKERQKAHCLNQTAAMVWRHCDGRTSVEEISRRMTKEMPGSAVIDDRVVWYALAQFKRDHLLEEIEVPAGMLPAKAGLNRRTAIRALGLTAIVAVPLVTSMVAPTAAQAATCRAPAAVCTTSAQCCSGVCQTVGAAQQCA